MACSEAIKDVWSDQDLVNAISHHVANAGGMARVNRAVNRVVQPGLDYRKWINEQENAFHAILEKFWEDVAAHVHKHNRSSIRFYSAEHTAYPTPLRLLLESVGTEYEDEMEEVGNMDFSLVDGRCPRFTIHLCFDDPSDRMLSDIWTGYGYEYPISTEKVVMEVTPDPLDPDDKGSGFVWKGKVHYHHNGQYTGYSEYTSDDILKELKETIVHRPTHTA
jgi:hypothetical protein